MNKSVTVYELLGLIKDDKIKGETYIKYYNREYEDDDTLYVCLSNLLYKLETNEIQLNDKVEILEEDNSTIEKIKIEEDIVCNKFIKNKYGTKCYIKTHDKIIIEKLNEVIDYINRKEDK